MALELITHLYIGWPFPSQERKKRPHSFPLFYRIRTLTSLPSVILIPKLRWNRQHHAVKLDHLIYLANSDHSCPCAYYIQVILQG